MLPVALLGGFCSGFLAYLAVGIMLPGQLAGVVQAAVFFGIWFVSTVFLRRDAKTVSKVWSRAFLLGAAEWLAMPLVGLAMTTGALAGTSAGSAPKDAGALAAAGAVTTVVGGGVGVFMAVACLVGFFIARSMGQEAKPEQAAPTRKCPQCAEMIQAEARKCRYCGSDLSAPAVTS